jgi:glucose/arabinose dehydrogenase
MIQMTMPGEKMIERDAQTKIFHPGMLLLLALLVLFGCQTDAPAATEIQPIEDGPVLLRENISLRKIAETGNGSIRLALNPVDGNLYYLRPTEGVFQLVLSEPFPATKVADNQDILEDGLLAGMAFGPDGALYIVLNRRPSDTMTQAVVQKGILTESGEYIWENFVTTEPYPASNTNFDHLFNGIVVSPDNQWVFLNSGSRTDHGEVQDNDGAFPETREVAITSAIFRIPTSAVNLTLPNDESALREMEVIFADGTRNAYDLAFAPDGELFAGDNGPDADYPDELNWLRQGLHYGFPWRFGDQDNPQQFPDYDPEEDNRLSSDFVAVQGDTYQNDPDFPPPPTETFANPVVNLGPDAAQYRDDEGQAQDAAAGDETLSTFTPHRSPLGLEFVTDDEMPAYFRSNDDTLSAFILSWGAAGGDLSDQGQDLLHLRLSRNGDNYEAATTQIARDFRRPIDAVLFGNRLYVLEWDGDGIIWELTFE